MCGRYSLTTPLESVTNLFGFDERPNLAPRFNIAPTQDVLTVRAVGDAMQGVMMRWGLVPSWAKDIDIGARMINARSETVAEKPAFRRAFKKHRCLVPADGLYEWQKTKTGKQPYRIAMRGDALFAFAGLWEQWQSPDGSVLESCTIVTTTATPMLTPIHPRMPVILQPQDYSLWLNGEPQDAAGLLQPFSGEELYAYPISSRVGNIRNDGPDLWEEVALTPEPPAKPEQMSLL